MFNTLFTMGPWNILPSFSCCWSSRVSATLYGMTVTNEGRNRDVLQITTLKNTANHRIIVHIIQPSVFRQKLWKLFHKSVWKQYIIVFKKSLKSWFFLISLLASFGFLFLDKNWTFKNPKEVEHYANENSIEMSFVLESVSISDYYA